MDTPLGAAVFGILLGIGALSATAWWIAMRIWWSEPVQELVLRYTGHSRLVPTAFGNRISPKHAADTRTAAPGPAHPLSRAAAPSRVTSPRGGHQLPVVVPRQRADTTAGVQRCVS